MKESVMPMKSCAFVLVSLCMCLLLTGFVSPIPVLEASESDALDVEEILVCKDVVGLTPVGANANFKASVGRLFCFTKIIGAEFETTVTHVWYFGESKEAWVALEVGSARWRTYSSKVIQSHQVGQWRVEVLGPDVELLKTIEFEVVP
ncbi:MAG: DUF2914 domain-containing protein [Deltaproteobacteria bacterium]|nr:DUF2914 domain-containing protein [Deltaproteobacteria bacterium]